MGKKISSGYISATINGIKINSSIQCNSTNKNNNSERTVSYIVMHYTGNKKDTAKANANYFKGKNRGASAHFFVDDSNIYQSVELRDTAWHCGANSYKHSNCRNFNSIGIEMCCTAGNYKISSKTIENAAHLVAKLCKDLGIAAKEVDKYVLRHYDVTGKACPKQMSDGGKYDADWVDFLNDVRAYMGATEIAAPRKSYLVKVTASALNIRKGAGTSYAIVGCIRDKGIYTIVETDGSWGKLKSGKGWIHLGYTKLA